MSTIMEVTDLYRIYRMGQEKIAAVDGISLQVEAGEILCLQGPSGSGKSTLLHMMAGLDRPSKGSIVIGKTHIEKLGENQLALFRQRHIGFIFQSYYLIPTLTAIENVTLPLMFCGMSHKKRSRKARELLEAVGLKDRMYHKPNQMSGGQQQRVSIARAFANDPKIVFADEPTGNLDTHTTYEMMNLMTRLARDRNQTLIIVTHDMEISEYASRIVKIRDGRIEGILLHDKPRGAAPPPPTEDGAPEEPLAVNDTANVQRAADGMAEESRTADDTAEESRTADGTADEPRTAGESGRANDDGTLTKEEEANRKEKDGEAQ